MTTLPEDIRAEGLALAKDALFMGQPLSEFDGSDLLAIAALGWNAYGRELSYAADRYRWVQTSKEEK